MPRGRRQPVSDRDAAVKILTQSQTLLLIFAGVLYILMTVYSAYYPLARTFTHTLFATPSLYGVWVSDRFVTLDWWITSLQTLAWLPVFWAPLMLLFWRSRGYKVAHIVVLSILLLLEVTTLVVNSVWISSGKNDPRYPDNPASSLSACCTPEFYQTVTTCPNFARPSPQCNPPIALNQLGTDGTYVFGFVINVLLIPIFALMLWLTVRLDKAVQVYDREEKGADGDLEDDEDIDSQVTVTTTTTTTPETPLMHGFPTSVIRPSRAVFSAGDIGRRNTSSSRP